MPRHPEWWLALLCLVAAGVQADHLERLEVTRDAQRYRIEGAVFINAPRAAVYRVITDYDHLHELDEGIAESRVVERVDATTVLVYTRVRGCIAFFCRDVERVERVEENAPLGLVSVAVPEAGDVRFSRSQWSLESREGGTYLLYETDVEPDFWIPRLIGPALFKSVLRRSAETSLHRLEALAQAVPL